MEMEVTVRKTRRRSSEVLKMTWSWYFIPTRPLYNATAQIISMDLALGRSSIDGSRVSLEVDTRNKVRYLSWVNICNCSGNKDHIFFTRTLAEAIYLEFQAPSSLCANSTLQQNLKSMMKNADNLQEREDETTTNTFLYPNQVYSNWFLIDIFV